MTQSIATAAPHAATSGAMSLLWLTIALPFAGFLVNGWLSLRRPQAKGVVSFVGPAVLVGAFVVAVLAVL